MLGFNEPDLGDQSNMSVQDALAAWPKLESIGLPLGSPATAKPGNGCMTFWIRQSRKINVLILSVYICMQALMM
ncbi:hypothetical protein CS542_06290 [Pedobacter sp. IW39]|nr:hypothetical protein CS542_06290 [Pedobacter sp. IW39]